MLGIEKNHYKVLATIAALASILIVNAATIGTGGYIALARHRDNTNVFENSDINVQTDTGQRQVCKTGGSTSPISNSCTASSSNTISQDGGVIESPTQGAVPPSSCTTMHPTVLTLSVSPTSVRPSEPITFTGTLTDTCTGSGVAGATITGEYGAGTFPGVHTDATGVYTISGLVAPLLPGTYTAQAHFAGRGIFGPSDSGIQTYTVL